MMNRSTASENEWKRARKRQRKREREAGDDVDNKSLYFCFYEDFDTKNMGPRYSVGAIKLNDLFGFSDTTKHIVIYPSRSKSKSEDCDVLRDVAFLGRDDGLSLPVAMGFGVYGSQTVLVGGCFFDERKLKRVPRISYALDTTDPKPTFQESGVIPHVRGHAVLHRPLLKEIDGKLYALCREYFLVFDPHCVSNQTSETKLWTRLPHLPRGSPLSCSVVGRKIIASVTDSSMFCYDLDEGIWTEIEPLWGYPSIPLVMECEDEFDKLMFTFYGRAIQVSGILLSDEGVPTGSELIATIELPELPSLSDSVLTSFSCAYLGDGKVCLAMLYLKHFDCRPLLVFTFHFAYMKAGDISSSSTSDPSFLRCESYSGSFSARALGCKLFEFIYAGQRPPDIVLSNCFVL